MRGSSAIQKLRNAGPECSLAIPAPNTSAGNQVLATLESKSARNKFRRVRIAVGLRSLPGTCGSYVAGPRQRDLLMQQQPTILRYPIVGKLTTALCAAPLLTPTSSVICDQECP